MSPPPVQNPRLAILMIVIGMAAISINDMTFKQVSGDYALHQVVFARSAIGLVLTLFLVQLEGGFSILRTNRPWLHLLRGLMVVFANMAYFAALAAMPLADATALFFVAPLMITLMSVPFLGERVGPRRIIAVAVGFVGVLVMLRPSGEAQGWVLGLPIVAAAAYAGMQILTRSLGMSSKPSAMAVYIQLTFLGVSLGFFLVAGDGRFAQGVDNPSLQFLLRAWRWPEPEDWKYFLLVGALSAVVGYTLSAAYRLGSAATVAPFEYVAMPMAVFWGWSIFGDLPDLRNTAGILLIVGAGLFVFFRERHVGDLPPSPRPVQR